MTEVTELVDYEHEKERPTNVDVLNLTNQKLTRIELQDSAKAVSTLLLDNNEITKLENLDTLGRSLRQLSVAGNQLRRIANLNRLDNLTVLNLARNKLTRIDGLRTLSKLTWLNLSENEIQAIENLDGNLELKHLDLSNNVIRALGNLSFCRKLKTLLLHANEVRTLKNAASLLPRSVTILSLAENELSDLNEVAYLHTLNALEQLSLINNPCCEQPQLFAIPKRNVSTRQSGSPGGAENDDEDEELELEFDYRPFVLNWCIKLQILDGQLLTDRECLKAEWLWSQGRGRYFAIGEHFELCSYLAKNCPLRPSSAEEDSKLSRILSKREQYRQAADSEAQAKSRPPNAGASDDPRSAKRRLEHSGDPLQLLSIGSRAAHTLVDANANTESRPNRDRENDVPPAAGEVKQRVAQPQLASESVYIPVQTASSRGTTQPASRSRTPSSDGPSPLHLAGARVQPTANGVEQTARNETAPRSSQTQSASIGSSLGFASNRPSAYLPINISRLAQGNANAPLLLTRTSATSVSSQPQSQPQAQPQAQPQTQPQSQPQTQPRPQQQMQVVPPNGNREPQPATVSRKENVDPARVGLLQRDAPATLVTSQHTTLPNGTLSQVPTFISAGTVSSNHEAGLKANAMGTAKRVTPTGPNANESVSNVAALRCIQALFTETNRQIEFVREATRAQQLTLTLLTALIADVTELKTARRSDPPPQPEPQPPAEADAPAPQPHKASKDEAHQLQQDTTQPDVDAHSFVLVREDDAHPINIQCATNEYLRVTWSPEPEPDHDASTSGSSETIVGYQLLVDTQPMVLAYGRQRCTAMLEAAIVEPDRVHSLAVHRVARSAPPVDIASPLRFVAMYHGSFKQRFGGDASQVRATFFTHAVSAGEESQGAHEVSGSMSGVVQSEANASLCNTLSDASVSATFAALGTVYRAQLAASERRHSEADSDEHESEAAGAPSASSVSAGAQHSDQERVRQESVNESDSVTLSVTSANELNAQADSASPNEDNDEAVLSEEAPLAGASADADNSARLDDEDEADEVEEDDEAMSTIKQAPA